MEGYKREPVLLESVSIASGGESPKAINSSVPVVEMVSLDRLLIDYSYQRVVRAEGRKNIRKIIDGFDWRHFQPLLVSPYERDGEAYYVVIDGQHRALAALHHPDVSEVPAAIVDVDFKEQARVFVEINTQVVKMKPLEMWWAEYHAGFKSAVDAAELIHSGGHTVSKELPPKGDVDQTDLAYDQFLDGYSLEIWTPHRVGKFINNIGYIPTMLALSFIGDSCLDPRAANGYVLEGIAVHFSLIANTDYQSQLAESFGEHIDWYAISEHVRSITSQHLNRRKPFEIFLTDIFKPFLESYSAPAKRIA